MDIEFIEEEYRNDIFQLMEVCGIDMTEAYQLYQNAGLNYQSATQMYFNKGQNNRDVTIPPQQPKKSVVQKKVRVPVSEDFDDLYDRFVTHKQSGVTFPEKYQIKRVGNGLMNLIPSFLKRAPENQFKKKLEQYIGKQCLVKFCLKSATQTLQQVSWKQKFPLIIHSLNFAQQKRTHLSGLYRNELLVDMFNVQFRNYGIDTKSYELEPDLREFIDLHEENYLIVLRVNALDEIEELQKFSLLEITAKQIMKKLKVVKSTCINKEMDEAHCERRLRQQMMGNYAYSKPVSINEKRKLTQDRAIRKKQEEEFYQSMKKQEERNKLNQQKNQSLPKNEKKQQNQIKQQSKKTNKQEIAKKKLMIRKNLKIYDDGMMIKLRIPSGNSIKVVVNQSQKVSYLYDYVFSLEEDLGFEDQIERKFDILRPYDQLNLTDKLETTLEQAFEGSDMESLIVNQK